MTTSHRTQRNVAIASIAAILAVTSPALAFSQNHHSHATNVARRVAHPSFGAGRTGASSSPLSLFFANNNNNGGIDNNKNVYPTKRGIRSSKQQQQNLRNLPYALSASSETNELTADATSTSIGESSTTTPTTTIKTLPREKPTLQQDIQNVIMLLSAQGVLILLSPLLSYFLKLPNRGLGIGFELSSSALISGLQWTLPLFGMAAVLQLIEPYAPSLKDVTKATQRSVLAVMGPIRRPVFAFIVSVFLGAIAGWGEEWLFRGVFQTILSQKWGDSIALGISGVVFGLLHAVTPVYALLAGTASVFFGYLYNISGNLAVPMVCHAFYDVGALMWAHWSVTGLSVEEQEDIMDFGGGSAPILTVEGKE